MTTRTKRRSGIVKYVGNMIDETKDLIDDILDRGRDVEHDLRDTARRAFDYDDEEEERDSIQQDLAALRVALASLTTKVEELAALQAEKKPASAPKGQ